MKKFLPLFLFAPFFIALAGEPITPSDHVTSAVQMQSTVVEHSAAPVFSFDVTVTKPDGSVRWAEHSHNTVVTEGKTQLLDCQFAASGCVTTWYVMLKHTGTIAAGDTLASHAGWTEATPYSGNRPSISWSAASGNSKTASAAVSYSINATDTDVAGACIASAASGTTGTLYSCSNFTGVRSVLSGDTVTVTPTVTD